MPSASAGAWMFFAPVALIGIIIAFLAILYYRKIFRSIDIFILSILVILFVQVLFLIFIFASVAFNTLLWDETTCDFFVWCSIALRFSELFTMAALSIDRVLIIRLPGKYRYYGSYKVFSVILVITIFSFFLGCVPIVGWSQVDFYNDITQNCLFLAHEISVKFGIFITIMILAVVFLAGACLLDVFFHMRSLNSHTLFSTKAPGNPSANIVMEKSKSYPTPVFHTTLDIATAYDSCKIVCIICGLSFLLNQMPYTIIVLHGVIMRSEILTGRLTSLWLLLLEALILPQLLWIFNARYRAAYKHLLDIAMCKVSPCEAETLSVDLKSYVIKDTPNGKLKVYQPDGTADSVSVSNFSYAVPYRSGSESNVLFAQKSRSHIMTLPNGFPKSYSMDDQMLMDHKKSVLRSDSPCSSHSSKTEQTMVYNYVQAPGLVQKSQEMHNVTNSEEKTTTEKDKGYYNSPHKGVGKRSVKGNFKRESRKEWKAKLQKTIPQNTSDSINLDDVYVNQGFVADIDLDYAYEESSCKTGNVEKIGSKRSGSISISSERSSSKSSETSKSNNDREQLSNASSDTDMNNENRDKYTSGGTVRNNKAIGITRKTSNSSSDSSDKMAQQYTEDDIDMVLEKLSISSNESQNRDKGKTEKQDSSSEDSSASSDHESSDSSVWKSPRNNSKKKLAVNEGNIELSDVENGVNINSLHRQEKSTYFSKPISQKLNIYQPENLDNTDGSKSDPKSNEIPLTRETEDIVEDNRKRQASSETLSQKDNMNSLESSVDESFDITSNPSSASVSVPLEFVVMKTRLKKTSSGTNKIFSSHHGISQESIKEELSPMESSITPWASFPHSKLKKNDSSSTARSTTNTSITLSDSDDSDFEGRKIGKYDVNGGHDILESNHFSDIDIAVSSNKGFIPRNLSKLPPGGITGNSIEEGLQHPGSDSCWYPNAEENPETQSQFVDEISTHKNNHHILGQNLGISTYYPARLADTFEEKVSNQKDIEAESDNIVAGTSTQSHSKIYLAKDSTSLSDLENGTPMELYPNQQNVPISIWTQNGASLSIRTRRNLMHEREQITKLISCNQNPREETSTAL